MAHDITAATSTIIGFLEHHRAWAPFAVFGLAFLESLALMSLILPFWGILVAIGVLAGNGPPAEFWYLLIAAGTGAALGDWLSYWLGFHYQAQIAAAWPMRNYPGLLPRGQAFFEKWGPWAIVFGRFSGPLRATIPLIAGAVRMPNWVFQSANWPSAFLWAAVLLVFGDGMGDAFQWLSAKLGLGR